MRTFFLSLRRQWWIILAFLIIIGLTVLYIFTMRARAAPEQPIAFNHQIMVGFGIDCLYCHTDAIRSPAAGIPSMEKCMGCHSIIDTQNAEIQKVAGYWERQEPIPWGRVNHLPRFVYFSHQVHVAAGFNCERCHGDVAHMTVAEPAVHMTMGWCLDCHEQQPEATALRDCILCHE
jgi:hypothetical protein